ncbi:MAG: glycosyltransferase [Candidatus Aureabacteria bacterium]|nr:glycosyltransferase [Candidatus Auribacterota bacterium]
MEKSPKVSVIIPVYNGEKTIKECLDSIFLCSSKDFEVIVIDDGSQDKTGKIAENYPCRLIRLEENRGRSCARNKGIEASRSRYLLFTDADCIVDRNWPSVASKEFQRLLKKDPQIAAMEGRILPLKGFINKCDAYAGYGYNQNLREAYHEHFCTANLIADREKIMQVGGFDEKLQTHEDQDLGFRLMEAGFRLYYMPNFSVVHNHSRMTLRDFVRHHYDWGKTLGNYFDIRYEKFRKTPLSSLMKKRFFYLLLMPVVSFFITLKITIHNFTYDPSVIIVFPFVFLSKMAYRLGGLQFIKNRLIDNLLPEQKEM